MQSKNNFFDAKLRFALFTPFFYVNVELKQSEARKEKEEKSAKRNLVFDAKLRFKLLFSFSFFRLASPRFASAQYSVFDRSSNSFP